MSTRTHLTAAMGLIVLAGAAAAQQGAPDAGMAPPNEPGIPALFAPAEGLPAPEGLPAWLTPVLAVQLDDAVLLGSAPGTAFVVEPEAGLTFTCIVEHVDRYEKRRVVLDGPVADAPDGSFVFAVYDDAAAMVLRVPSQQRLYQLQFMGGGAYWVCRVDENLVPECSGGVSSPPAPPRILTPDDDDWLPEGGGSAPDGDGGGCTGGTPMIDTMVVYTPAARAAAGGHSAIRAQAATAIVQTNLAYTNSRNTVRARLVYCDEVAYTESGSNATDLSRLRGTGDGFMDGVHAIRDRVNADLVALFHTGGGGIGNCISVYDRAFSISDWTGAAASLFHAHETGHNLGCAHDIANVDCSPWASYGYGWRFFGSDGNQYRTVMAYSPGTRIGYFSNPSVSFLGTPTGVGGSADNARIIDNRDRTIEDFELTRYDIYVDFAWSGLEFGTYSLPYNTLPEGIFAIDVPEVGAAATPQLYISAGETATTGTIFKRMVINACGGTVRIGVP